MSAGDEVSKLVQAAAAGDRAALDALIAQKVSPSALAPVFGALLHAGDVGGVAKLLAHGLSPNGVVDRDLPLNIAIEGGHHALFKFLLERGAEVDPKVNFIFYPLGTIVRRILRCEPDAVPAADMEVVHTLLKEGADPRYLSLGDEAGVEKYKRLAYLLRDHGWVPLEERVLHGGPP